MADDKNTWVLKDDRDAADVILSELDRLRATVARLQEELAARPMRTCWVGADSQEDACEAVAYACRVIATDEDESVECDDGQEVYAVELRAQRVERKTP